MLQRGFSERRGTTGGHHVFDPSTTPFVRGRGELTPNHPRKRSINHLNLTSTTETALLRPVFFSASASVRLLVELGALTKAKFGGMVWQCQAM